MANYLDLVQFRNLNYGPQVKKTAVALPNNATAAVFTVATGNVLVTSLIGQVTTAFTAAAFNLSIGAAPTVGTASSSAIATATAVGTHETGTWFTPQASSGLSGALVIGSNAGAVVFEPAAFTASPGTITWTTSANPGAGAATLYLTYVPLDPGANVT